MRWGLGWRVWGKGDYYEGKAKARAEARARVGLRVSADSASAPATSGRNS